MSSRSLAYHTGTDELPRQPSWFSVQLRPAALWQGMFCDKAAVNIDAVAGPGKPAMLTPDCPKKKGPSPFSNIIPANLARAIPSVLFTGIQAEAQVQHRHYHENKMPFVAHTICFRRKFRLTVDDTEFQMIASRGARITNIVVAILPKLHRLYFMRPTSGSSPSARRRRSMVLYH